MKILKCHNCGGDAHYVHAVKKPTCTACQVKLRPHVRPRSEVNRVRVREAKRRKREIELLQNSARLTCARTQAVSAFELQRLSPEKFIRTVERRGFRLVVAGK